MKSSIIKPILAAVLAIVIAGVVICYFLIDRKGPVDVEHTTTEPESELVTASETETSTNVTALSETSTGSTTATDISSTATTVAQSETATSEEPSSAGKLTTDDITPLPVPKEIVINEDSFNLSLVNNRYKRPANYEVKLATAVEGYDVELDYRVAPYYQAMYDAAAAEGIYLIPYSGYRSYERQEINYTNKTQYYLNQGYDETDAKSLAARIIMPPGCSEHNLGLAMDICGTDYDFDKTAEYKWLTEHAAEYGFILRYTEEKQLITQVVCEPWHWRFVGVEYAAAINASGLCLEEYFSQNNLMPQTAE